MRDNQRDIGRAQAYRAERTVFGAGSPFDTRSFPAADVRAMVAIIVPGCTRIDFAPGDGRAEAWGGAGRGRLRFTHNEKGNVAAWVVLHECAHLLAPVMEGHGPEWRRIYCRLVADWCSPKVAEALARAFETEPLRKAAAPGRPRKRRRFVVREESAVRPLLDIEPDRNGCGNQTDYARAKGMLAEGETLRTTYGSDRIRCSAVRITFRDATPEEIATLTTADKARMRRGGWCICRGRIEITAKAE